VAVGGAAPTAAADIPDHRAFATVMTGAAEVPGPGDPDGVGVAGLVVSVTREKICYVLAVRRIGTAVAAHIHAGAADEAGPVVVPLDPPARGFSANCTDVSADLAAAIIANPAGYYVNVHTADFPNGAIRGQLH
jgi:hypothetical protein